MKSVRFLNGYRVIYKPEHHRAMSCGNWVGYVYEHVVVAGDSLGRILRDNEVIHHLNGVRNDNRPSNLLVLDSTQHGRLHAWINAGAPGLETLRMNGVNSAKTAVSEPKYCSSCGVLLINHSARRCLECSLVARRKVVWPTFEQLQHDLEAMSVVAVGKKYGVSDNAVRKWLRHYEKKQSTLSQALGTPGEVAETSGAV